MPTDPVGPGAPVLSVYQAVDTIVYGANFADYLANEFGIARPDWAQGEAALVPLWGEAFDLT